MPHRPPFLEAFFREERGTVYFKGYPPYRGDDMQSVVELARILPPNVNFVPIPPIVPHVGDLRHLLQAVLQVAPQIDLAGMTQIVRTGQAPGERTGRESAKPEPKALDGSAGKSAGPAPVPNHAHNEVRLAVLQLLEECLPESSRPLAAQLVEAIQNTPLYDVLANTVASTLYGPIDQLSYVPIVPDEGPILVVGRPELFHHDTPFGVLRNPLALPNILHEAGYPNRFDFLIKSNGLLIDTSGIRDRKTNMCHDLETRYSDDVGFVFLNSVADGRIVIVASGTTAFGTLAAVRLLSEERPAFARVMAQQGAHLEQGKPAAIDLAFRCHHVRSREAMLFPFSQPHQALTILPLNGRDMLGYRWNRRVHKLFEWLFDWWTTRSDLKSERTFPDRGQPQLFWSCDPRPIDPTATKPSLVNVKIAAEAWVSGRHEIVAGPRMSTVLSEIRQQMLEDMKAWYFRTHRRHSITGQETFRPILLVGETGTGKTIVSECIGDIWSGSTLENVADEWPRGEPVRPGEAYHSNALLDAAEDGLDRLLNSWPEHTPSTGSRTLTFSPVSTPETMLDKELFGSAAGFASTAGPAPGVFLLAGSGVLFLDELLELPLDQQARLLVALQKGWVRPLGAGRDYGFRCRLVVATNRAATMQELEQLAESDKLNQALIARLKYRYELPPLRERAEVIMPLIINLIQERATRDGICKKRSSDPQRRPPVYVRISRPALEALLGYDFPENVRDVERFVNSLSRGLIEAFGAECRQESPDQPVKPESITAIRLSDLDVLQPARSNYLESDGTEIGKSLEPETEFFQFTLNLTRRPLKPSLSDWLPSAEAEVRNDAAKDLRERYNAAVSLLFAAEEDAAEQEMTNCAALRDRIGAFFKSDKDPGAALAAALADPVVTTSLKRVIDRWGAAPSSLRDIAAPELEELWKLPWRPDWTPGRIDGDWRAIRRTLPFAILAERYQELVTRRNELAQAGKGTQEPPVGKSAGRGRGRAPAHEETPSEDRDSAIVALNSVRNEIKAFVESLEKTFQEWKKLHIGSGDSRQILSKLLGINIANLR